jgi:RNA polymerase subunit RPABC4/transcription elongation factor Spt4
MDQIIQQIGKTVSDVLSSPPVRIGFQAFAIYWIILWLAASYWAFRDMQLRTENPVLPYVMASLIILFTPVLFPAAVVVYRIIRPQERIGEVYERNLAEEALLAEVEAVHTCPTCARRIDDEWIICPACRTRLKRVCPNCSRLVGLDWSLCAWCGKDFERRDVAAASLTELAIAARPTPIEAPAPTPIARAQTRAVRPGRSAPDPLPER